MGNSTPTAPVHMLDYDSLLNVFYLYRPFLLGEDGDDDDDVIFGGQKWDRGRWWYKPAQVCQRWRNVILGSAAYLGVFLVCTNGTPVANMLANSPPLPLLIDYRVREEDDITAEDEEGAILALRQYDHVRRIRLVMPVESLQKLVVAMDEEYPILEYLITGHPGEDETTILIFPETLQAPRLHHLVLGDFSLPIGSRLLTTAVSLVTLCLYMDYPSSYFHPNTLLQWLSFMPKLETLLIAFYFTVPDQDVEGQLTHMPAMTTVTLPNLHVLKFRGVVAFLEAFIHRITAPHLEKLIIGFLDRLTVSVPCLLQFVNATENLRFGFAKFEFSNNVVDVEVYPNEEANMYALSVTIDCSHLDWQVSSAARIFNADSPVFFAVGHLILDHEVHRRSSEEHNEAGPTEWRKILSSFRNVKTLRVATGLVKDLSRSLQLDNGELPLGLLPELQELTYYGSGNTGDAFTSFVDARQKAGHPITLSRL